MKRIISGLTKIGKNFKDSYCHIPYTFNHWRAFRNLENHLYNKKKLEGDEYLWKKHYFHDWDKLIIFFLFPWLGDRWVNKYHRSKRNHHPDINKPIEDIDWIEAVIDWECARFTKPDKPLNARQTLNKYYKTYESVCLPVINYLGL